jgi:hypothetical protein
VRTRKEHELTFGGRKSTIDDVSGSEFIEEHLRSAEAKKSVATVEIETLLLGQIARYLEPAKLSDLACGKLEKFSIHRRLDDGVAAATLNEQIRTV